MVLSDRKIRALIDSYKLVDPVKDSQINPASVNLTLGDTFLIPRIKHNCHVDLGSNA